MGHVLAAHTPAGWEDFSDIEKEVGYVKPGILDLVRNVSCWYTYQAMDDVYSWLGRVLTGGKWLKAKRNRQRDFFILKAIANGYTDKVGYSISGSPLDLRTVEGMIGEAQLVAAGCHTGDSCYLEPLVTSQEDLPYSWELKKIELRYGLPALNNPHRLHHIEEILFEMSDSGKLKFHPPDKWSII
jgi:hypothetical protein